MTLAIWRRRGRSLLPASEVAEDFLRSLQDGDDCLMEGKRTRPRNLQQLRLWWALCGVMVEHSFFPSSHAASWALKIAGGHVNIVVLPDTGEVHLVPKSISFNALGQLEFSALFDAAVRIICERWMPGVEDDALKKEVFEMLDGDEKSSLGKRVA